MRLLAALLIAALPTAGIGQGFDTRPDAATGIQPFVLPDAPVAPPPPAPAPVQEPPPLGGFAALPLTAPTIESLLRNRTLALSRADAQDLNTPTWPYAVYDSGMAGTKPNRSIVVLMPPGAEAKQILTTLDMRAWTRTEGWRLLFLPIPQTQRVQSGTLAEIAEAQRTSANDGQRVDRVLAALLSQEGVPQAPIIIASEGAGNGLLALLCGRAGRSPAPSAAVVLGGTLDTSAAAACQPSRVPALLIARSTSDSGVPYGGGEQPAIPGQPQTRSDTILSAASTRGLWAVLARCRDTQPTLTWLSLSNSQGRTALETHTQCSAGGPVAMLTALDGATIPAGEDLVEVIAAFLKGDLL